MESPASHAKPAGDESSSTEKKRGVRTTVQRELQENAPVSGYGISWSLIPRPPSGRTRRGSGIGVLCATPSTARRRAQERSRVNMIKSEDCVALVKV